VRAGRPMMPWTELMPTICPPAPLPYVSIRQHTSVYVRIRQHTSVYVSIREHTPAYVRIRPHTSAYVRIRQHTWVTPYEHNTHTYTLLSAHTTYTSIRTHIYYHEDTHSSMRTQTLDEDNDTVDEDTRIGVCGHISSRMRTQIWRYKEEHARRSFAASHVTPYSSQAP
jgi:hypothetical protein